MTTRKKTAKNERERFLSVVPVTSRATTGTTTRQLNLRSEMMLRIKKLTHAVERDTRLLKRLKAACAALGSMKERKTHA